MAALHNRRSAACGPLALTTAAFALASAAGAAARLVCTGPGINIGISIDGSGSIMKNRFNTVRGKIADFVEDTSGFSTGAANENLYYVNVWNTAVQSDTDSFRTNADGAVSAEIDALQFPSGGTDIADGLLDLEKQFALLPEDAGAQIAILFTDGQSNGNRAEAAANKLRDLGVTVAAVGLGNGVDEGVLKRVASERDDGSELVFRVGTADRDIQTIGGVFEMIVSEIDTDGDGVSDCEDLCPEDGNKTEPGKCGCGKPETFFCKKFGKKFGHKFGHKFSHKFSHKFGSKFGHKSSKTFGKKFGRRHTKKY